MNIKEILEIIDKIKLYDYEIYFSQEEINDVLDAISAVCEPNNVEEEYVEDNKSSTNNINCTKNTNSNDKQS